MPFRIALLLLALQGALGAFDTLYYHEWRARLPMRGRSARPELQLHAARDFIYAILFVSLPLVEWRGLWAGVLVLFLAAEMLFTFWDFIVEDRVRRSLGGLYPGERITHALMGIVYGGMLGYLVPVVAGWWKMPTALVASGLHVASSLRWVLLAMGLGVLLSGVRDLAAAVGVPHSDWPWTVPRETA